MPKAVTADRGYGENAVADVWAHRLRYRPFQRRRVLCDPHRSDAIADLFVALPQWAHADAVGNGIEAHPLGPGFRVHPEHPALSVRRWVDLLRRL